MFCHRAQIFTSQVGHQINEEGYKMQAQHDSEKERDKEREQVNNY